MLLVLRLLSVYFAGCAVSLFLVHRFVIRIRPGVALLLAFGPFLLTGKALLTAGVYAPLDIAYQGQPLASHRDEQGIGPTRSPILGCGTGSCWRGSRCSRPSNPPRSTR